jgi:hypothetical protein
MILDSGEQLGVCMGGKLHNVLMVFPEGANSHRWKAPEGMVEYRKTKRETMDGWPIWEPR